MEIPVISGFIEGLKLFLRSKRLKWLTIVFIIALIAISGLTVIGRIVLDVSPALQGAVIFVTALGGGIWPVFFMLTALVSSLGMQKYVASEESYKKSLLYLIPWIIISSIILIMFILFALPIFLGIIFGVAFFGWIAFQAYLSTRNALKYADMADTQATSRWMKLIVGVSNLFCYFVIIGSLIFTVVFINPELLNFLIPGNALLLGLLVLGALAASGFNFVNGLIMARHRNKTTLDNVALVGLFISLYSAYFIYNAGKPAGTPWDFVGVAISIFFVIYTMSSVGRTLASRENLDTRIKISGETAAGITFFMAIGYYFADLMFPILVDPAAQAFAESISDLVKLLIFPLIALIMELFYLRRIGKVADVKAEEKPVHEPVEEEEKHKPEESEPEKPSDEPETEMEPDSSETEKVSEETPIESEEYSETEEEPDQSEESM
ncbi:MAG: conserved membrane protein of unknown function [Candidatus Thorarchaeota archaeon]|nr:MAG: conserved membrane protein of unknown function [Candidatus Thorarchaeota archaeon]